MAHLRQDEVRARFEALDLNGAIIRFSSRDTLPRWITDREMRMDLLSHFVNATPMELDTLSERLSGDITHLRSLHVRNPFTLQVTYYLSVLNVIYRTLKKCSGIPMIMWD